MDQFSPISHNFYSPAVAPHMPVSLGLASGFSLQRTSQISKQPYIIGICGGSCCGKSQITEKLKLCLDFSASVINEFDFYYPNLTAEDNFDSPDSINWELLKTCLNTLNSKATFECPKYDMINHQQQNKKIKIYPTQVIIVEGMFIFIKEEIRNLFDLKIFVDCPDDVRLGNRVKKFTREMGMSLEFIIEYYLKYTKVAYQKHIEPSKVFADVIIPNYGTMYQSKGVDFIVGNLVQLMYGAEVGGDMINRLRYTPLKFS